MNNVLRHLKDPAGDEVLIPINTHGEREHSFQLPNILFFVTGNKQSWFPVIDSIPRLLPASLRSREWDERFYRHHIGAFRKQNVHRQYFSDNQEERSPRDYFQAQRFIWGKQPPWHSLYEHCVGYDSPSPHSNRTCPGEGESFFSMNLHCYYGQQPRLQDFVDEINASEGRLVLDVGCGNRSKRNLIDIERNSYVGIDMLGDLGPDIQASAYALPFEDGIVDYVFCDSLLEHVYDPFRVIAEIRRVLGNRGKGYFVVPFSYKNHGAPFDFFRYTKSGFHTLLRDFSEISIYSFGGYVHALGHMIESFYPHVAANMGRSLKALHNSIFFFLNKLDKFDRHKLFCRGYYAFVTK